MVKRTKVDIDERMNNELQLIINRINLVTGVKYGKTDALRFLIKHYNMKNEKIQIRRKPKSKKELLII